MSTISKCDSFFDLRSVVWAGLIVLTLNLFSFNVIAETIDYYVHTKTSSDEGAGTNADVFITLIGKNGASNETKLHNTKHKNFQRGDAHWYRITTDTAIGRITSIRLELRDGAGGKMDDGWKIDFIYLVAPVLDATIDPKWPTAQAWYDGRQTLNGDFYRFYFQDGSFNADDGSVKRTVYHATYNDTQVIPFGSYSYTIADGRKGNITLNRDGSFENVDGPEFKETGLVKENEGKLCFEAKKGPRCYDHSVDANTGDTTMVAEGKTVVLTPKK